MSDAEAYLRELRHALPLGCRRRFVAELREHFASAIAAEANSAARGSCRDDVLEPVLMQAPAAMPRCAAA